MYYELIADITHSICSHAYLFCTTTVSAFTQTAQRLGLVRAPPNALTEDDWEIVKKQSRGRGDSQLPCPVCQEEFGIKQQVRAKKTVNARIQDLGLSSGPQVLLSCSHVFHKVWWLPYYLARVSLFYVLVWFVFPPSQCCLLAFERFSGKKFCPLCRTHNYQTRIVFDGANVCRHRAASRWARLDKRIEIEACEEGWLCVIGSRLLGGATEWENGIATIVRHTHPLIQCWERDTFRERYRVSSMFILLWYSLCLPPVLYPHKHICSLYRQYQSESGQADGNSRWVCGCLTQRDEVVPLDCLASY